MALDCIQRRYNYESGICVWVLVKTKLVVRNRLLTIVFFFVVDSLSISDILGFGSMINSSSFGSSSGVGANNSCENVDLPLNTSLGYNSQTPSSSITSPGAFNMTSPQTTFDAFQVSWKIKPKIRMEIV